MSARRIAQLRAGLAFASQARRPAIQAMIDELECGFTKSPACVAGNAAGQPIVAAAQEPVPSPLPVQEADCRGSDVDASPVKATSEKAKAGGRTACPEPSSEGGHIPGTAGSLAPCDAPPGEAAGEAPVEPCQPPPAGRRHRLTFDSRIVIAPDRPAPPRRYADGSPALFRDDLTARGDHGSPHAPPRADDFWASPTGSSLAGAI